MCGARRYQQSEREQNGCEEQLPPDFSQVHARPFYMVTRRQPRSAPVVARCMGDVAPTWTASSRAKIPSSDASACIARSRSPCVASQQEHQAPRHHWPAGQTPVRLLVVAEITRHESVGQCCGLMKTETESLTGHSVNAAGGISYERHLPSVHPVELPHHRYCATFYIRRLPDRGARRVAEILCLTRRSAALGAAISTRRRLPVSRQA